MRPRRTSTWIFLAIGVAGIVLLWLARTPEPKPPPASAARSAPEPAPLESEPPVAPTAAAKQGRHHEMRPLEKVVFKGAMYAMTCTGGTLHQAASVQRNMRELREQYLARDDLPARARELLSQPPPEMDFGFPLVANLEDQWWYWPCQFFGEEVPPLVPP